MNREIKFRGKRVDNGEWIYGVPYFSEGYWWMLVDDNTRTQEIGTGSYQIIPETVGQFTGLHDKNNKEVSEKDIVKVWRDGFCRTFTVKWREEGVPMYILYPQPLNEDFWHCRSDMGMAWEVIGNIHDNPELLEVV